MRKKIKSKEEDIHVELTLFCVTSTRIFVSDWIETDAKPRARAKGDRSLMMKVYILVVQVYTLVGRAAADLGNGTGGGATCSIAVTIIVGGPAMGNSEVVVVGLARFFPAKQV
jgi:hypothetical protein